MLGFISFEHPTVHFACERWDLKNGMLTVSYSTSFLYSQKIFFKLHSQCMIVTNNLNFQLLFYLVEVPVLRAPPLQFIRMRLQFCIVSLYDEIIFCGSGD